MGIVLKQSFLSSIATYFGLIVGYINMVFLFPQLLGLEKFGLLRLIMSTGYLLAQFGEFGLSSGVIKFSPYAKNKENSDNGFLSFVLWLILAISILAIASLYLFSDLLPYLFFENEKEIRENYFIISVITFATIVSEVLFAYSRSQLKNVAPVVIRELLLRFIQLALIILFHYNLLNFGQTLLLFGISYVSQALFILIYLNHKKLLRRGDIKNLKGKIRLKEFLTYSSYMALNKIPSTALNNIDILMLGALTNLKSVGIYSIALYIANVVIIPGRNLIHVTSPFVANHFKLNRIDEISKIYKQSALNLFIICGGLFILIFVNLNILLDFSVSESFEEVTFVFICLGLARLLNVATGIKGVLIYHSNFYRWSSVINALLLVATVVFNYLFIPVYGTYGAAIGSLLAVFLSTIFSLFLVYFKLAIHPFTKNQIKVALLFSVLLLLIIPNYTDFILLDGIVKSLIIIASLYFSVKYFNFSHELKKLLNSFEQRLSKL